MLGLVQNCQYKRKIQRCLTRSHPLMLEFYLAYFLPRSQRLSLHRLQGCTMAPLLFSIYFQAANEALLASFPDSASLIFKTAKDFIFTGRKVTPGVTGTAFSFDKSLCADDKTKLCDSRENLHLSLQRIFCSFQKVRTFLSRWQRWLKIED